MLLDAGADPNASHVLDTTPLWHAAKRGHESIAQLLLAHPNINTNIGSRESPLHAAIRSTTASRHRIIAMLLQAGADPDIRNTRKQTPLEFACAQQDADAVSMLIDAGASVNALSSFKCKTPLDIALRKTQDQLVALLKSSGGLTSAELTVQSFLTHSPELPSRHFIHCSELSKSVADSLSELLSADDKVTSLVLMRHVGSSADCIDIGRILASNTTLHSLSICKGTFTDEAHVERIKEGLKANGSLTHLHISDCRWRLPSVHMPLLVDGIRENTSLQSVTFSSCHIAVAEGLLFAKMLQENTTLRSLSLRNNDLTTRAARAFDQALAWNTTLTSIDLSSHDVGTESLFDDEFRNASIDFDEIYSFNPETAIVKKNMNLFDLFFPH